MEARFRRRAGKARGGKRSAGAGEGEEELAVSGEGELDEVGGEASRMGEVVGEAHSFGMKVGARGWIVVGLVVWVFDRRDFLGCGRMRRVVWMMCMGFDGRVTQEAFGLFGGVIGEGRVCAVLCYTGE